MAGKWDDYIPPEEEDDDEDKFIPLISLDKTLPEDNFKYLGNVDEIQEQLSVEFDERAQALEVIKFTKRATIRTLVEKGAEDAKIEEGTIFVITSQVKVTKVVCNDFELTQDQIISLGEQDYSFEIPDVKYGDTIDIEVSPYELGDNAYSNAYILFLYENIDYVKLHCGKIGFINTSKVGKRLVTNIEGLPALASKDILGLDASFDKTIAIANLYKNPGGLCFGVTMARVNEAYRDLWDETVLDLHNKKGTDYLYSGTTNPNIPDEYFGYGVGGALASNSNADLVTLEQVMDGHLEEGAVVQYWANVHQTSWNNIKNAIKNFILGIQSQNNKYYSYGHSFVFKSYRYDEDGNIIGIKFYDQWGTNRRRADLEERVFYVYNGKNKLSAFIFGANLKDL